MAPSGSWIDATGCESTAGANPKRMSHSATPRSSPEKASPPRQPPPAWRPVTTCRSLRRLGRCVGNGVCLRPALRPVRPDLPRPGTVEQELHVPRHHPRSKISRRVTRLGSERRIPLRITADVQPPPVGTWRGRRRCAAAGERATVVFEFQEIHECSSRERFTPRVGGVVPQRGTCARRSRALAGRRASVDLAPEMPEVRLDTPQDDASHDGLLFHVRVGG